MPRSMTGFGSAKVEDASHAVRVEVRSVNSRGLKVMVRAPDSILGCEAQIEKIVRECAKRGTIQVGVQHEDRAGAGAYALDEAAAAAYYEQLTRLGERLGVKEEIGLGALLSLPGVVQRPKEIQEIPPDLWALLERATREACQAMTRMRDEEGRFIWRDVIQRCALIGGLTAKVQERAPRMLEEYRQRLTQRLDELLSNLPEGPRAEDVHREVAFFADRSDVTEELIRMRSHLEQMSSSGASSEPIGRKVEFIIQEMFREANTMASKVNDPDMTQWVLEIKGEMEKLREQAFNLE